MTTIKMRLHDAAIDDLQPGETIRVNHDDCTAGADTRRRLYLTRVMAKPDLTIGYCHNCQGSGTRKTGKYESYRTSKHSVVGVSAVSVGIVPVVEEPEGIDRVLVDWPSEAKAWAIRCKLRQSDLALYRIGYDTSTDKIYLPRYDTVSVHTSTCIDLNGYQLRLLNGKGPKYTTVVNDKDKGYTTLSHREGAGKPKVSVVVEDLISGIHVIKAMCGEYNVDVFVNYGIKINIRLVHGLRAAPHTVVWLDNDSPHVVQQAQHYVRTIQLHSGKQVGVVKVYDDPKLRTGIEIKRAIKGCEVWTA